MDGHFVPNITLGPNIVKAIRPVTKLPLDVHLMITEPEKYIHAFAEAGADIIGIHAEATPHIHRAIQMIVAENVKAEIVINPGTPVSAIEHVLSMCDQVLVMTVNPGFCRMSAAVVPDYKPWIRTVNIDRIAAIATRNKQLIEYPACRKRPKGVDKRCIAS